jgi:hypothetical protein
LLDSQKDAGSAVGLGDARFLFSGSMILPLVKMSPLILLFLKAFPLLRILSHECPLSSVHVKSQSRTTIDAWFPLRCRFWGRPWLCKISFVRITDPVIGGGVPPVENLFSLEDPLNSMQIKFQNCTGFEVLLVNHQILMDFQF